MNYHIMVQDKFLDSYIEDIYAINEQDNNVFWFRGYYQQNGFVKTTRSVEYIGNDILFWKDKFSHIAKDDVIFVHWYDLQIAEVLYDLPNPIYVMLWGGEFYNEPFWYHKWVYDIYTLRYLKQTHSYPKIILTTNLLKLYRDFRGLYYFKKELKESYFKKNRLVGRIDFLITPTKTDFEKIKELYPAFKAKSINGFYDQNFDRASLMSTHKRQDNSGAIHILLGNSGAESNNHLDAMQKLRKLTNVIVYCPLSYGGSKEYITLITNKGQEYFGDNFIAKKDFMSREAYMRLYDEIDIVFMYHNRQQAFGNICTALTKGKPVFLKKQNTIKSHLDALHINTYDAAEVNSYDLNVVIAECKNNSSKNYEILKENISDERRYSDLRVLMSAINGR